MARARRLSRWNVSRGVFLIPLLFLFRQQLAGGRLAIGLSLSSSVHRATSVANLLRPSKNLFNTAGASNVEEVHRNQFTETVRTPDRILVHQLGLGNTLSLSSSQSSHRRLLQSGEPQLGVNFSSPFSPSLDKQTFHKDATVSAGTETTGPGRSGTAVPVATAGTGTGPSEDSNDDPSCAHVSSHPGHPDECSYIRAHSSCQSGSSIDYLQFYYCTCSRHFRLVGAVLISAWLLSLFFSLGNTAADYFCPSLEELSRLLHLPPTVAGVTLLPLGNGAPDVFASIAAFVGAGQGEVGLNSVLGSGLFVSTVVAGSVLIVVANMQAKASGGGERGDGGREQAAVRVDRGSFVRDVAFYGVSLVVLFLIILRGHISIMLALAFLGIYPLYGCSVAISEVLRRRAPLPGGLSLRLQSFGGADEDDGAWLYDPLLDGEEDLGGGSNLSAPAALPQWMWTSNVAIFSETTGRRGGGREIRPLWGWSEEEEVEPMLPCCSVSSFVFEYFIKLPLMLPRRLTIPTRNPDNWSKPYAIGSAAFAPFLCAFTFSGGYDMSWRPYAVAAAAGLVFSLLAFFLTDAAAPPRRFALPVVLAGFLMSVVWFYLIANELVAVLVAIGVILRLDPALLGLTVLAWGNSIGDTVANLALAANGGPDGIQCAWSGCIAGPMFNLLVGLGSSLVFASWQSFPAQFPVPQDPTLPYTLAFLLLGLLWSLLILPSMGMKLTRVHGAGLLLLYSAFITIRGLHTVGMLPLPAIGHSAGSVP
eukprot:TRINITY_DN5751_c0_g1_i1.p1 TRINITY_DN5751_c0_g1~~TRINITY_DN5751_c0_g1_i1.p1  ORF type:complete len:759 (+),score=47.84 TRINITY_DN5751_c0_g1_i1:342-2618(+)